MADQVQTLRPSNTVSLGGWLVSGTGAVAALSDDSDSTYVYPDANSKKLVLDLGDAAIPSNAKIRAIQTRFRVTSDVAGQSFTCLLRERLNGTEQASIVDVSSTDPSTYNGVWRVSDPSNEEWIDASVDSLQLILDFIEGAGKVYELFVDIYYNEAPVVTVTNPTGSITDDSQPPVEWSVTDAEGDDVNSYHVKIFTDAQYNAAGFDPDTSEAYYDSGEIISDATIHDPDFIDHGDTYRAYVRVSQVWTGFGKHWSAWAFSGFNMALTPPQIPELEVFEDPDNARNVLRLTEGGASPPTEWFLVWHSDDNGETWQESPLGVIEDSPAYDYEAIPGKERLYRARALHQDDNNQVASPLSATRSATLELSDWWVKHLDDPDKNLLVEMFGSDFAPASREDQAVFEPVGSSDPVVVSDVIRSERFNLTATFIDSEKLEAFKNLRREQRVLLLQSPFYGKQWFFKFGNSFNEIVYNFGDTLIEVQFEVVETKRP